MAHRADAAPGDPAAVIAGLACRLPGARNAAQAWQVLRDGRCTVGRMTPDLFDLDLYLDPRPARRGKAVTLASGQLDDIYRFDPAFFGISPREAVQIDPQQRLMLAAVWEAIEDAGLAAADLAGPRTGVFVGSSIVEHQAAQYFDPGRLESAGALGNTLSIVANRVSACFDFGGPSSVIDTACSSGLFALHNAVQSLRRDELDTAIVGGVHVLRLPGGFVTFSQARMMSPTGLCRAFDADADGYVRSEACVALVLQRADVAQRMLSRVRARVLATGTNTDGAASPLIVPSGPRQQALIEAVTTEAGRDPEDFAFYEAHGTGTQVGDPAEAGSIGRALAQLRRDPLLIGSAKTNFGHAEPVSGLIGMAKAVMALEQGALPASLHFNRPNPAIDFEALNLTVNTALTPLTARVAGVNSFGFGGTNVTAVIEAADPPQRRSVPGTALPSASPEPPRWLLLSAASDASLDAMATAWADRLEQACDPAELAAAAGRRARLPVRMAVPLNRDTADCLRQRDGLLTGRAPLARPRTVFAFAGNGAQFAGMGLPQYRADPVYRAAFDRVAAAFATEGVVGLADLLAAPDLADRLASPLVAQPLLFACQIAMVEMLGAAGLRPDAVIGHSVGEIAALHVAGAYDLPAAARIVASRSRAFEALRGTGGMAALALSATEAERALSGLGDASPALAAVNGPRSVTVAGDAAALERLSRVTVEGRRLAMVRLAVEVPYHSPAVDPLRDRFLGDLQGLAFSPLALPAAGAAVGRMLRRAEVGIDYLWRNARDTVRFAEALAALAAEGPAHVVEIAPRSILQANIRDAARFSGLPVAHFSPAPEGPAAEAAQRTVARAWVEGVEVNRSALAGEMTDPAPPLPPYPWDEADYRNGLSADGFDAWAEGGARRLAGRRPEREVPIWTADFLPVYPAWVADHQVGGLPVLPAAALIEVVLAAATELWPDAALDLRAFDILRPAVVQGDGLRLRTQIDPATGAVVLTTRSRLAEGEWSLLARGLVRRADAAPPPARRAPRREMQPLDSVYTIAAARGLAYGPSFRRAEAACKTGDGLWLRLAESSALGPQGGFMLDPTTLDAAFHGIIALLDRLPKGELARSLARGAALLPVRVTALTLWQPGRPAVAARVRVTGLRRRSLVADLVLEDTDGAAVAEARGVEFQAARLTPAPEAETGRWHLRRARARLPGDVVTLPRGWRSRLLRGLSPRPAEGGARQILADLRAALDGGQPVEPLLAQALRDCPDVMDDLRVAMGGPGARDIAQHAASTRAIWARAEATVADLARRWPAAERFSVLILGLPDLPSLRRLTELPGMDRLAISHPEAEGRSFLSQVLHADMRPLLAEEPAAGAFDLVLLLGEAAAADPGAAAASGALVLRMDAHADGPGHWTEDAPLPLRLQAETAKGSAEVPPPPALIPATPLPDGTPPSLALLAQGAGKPGWRLLMALHGEGESAEATLARLLLSLRDVLTADRLPLLLVLADAGGQGFATVAAGLSAAMRSLANERPDHPARLVVLWPHAEAGAAPDWPGLLTLAASEPVLHVLPDRVEVERLLPLPEPPATGAALRLAQAEPGRLETLHWHPAPRRAPQGTEVEIAVQAAGLNFRDVMLARGLLPERLLEGGASGAGLGMECAGVVTRAGPQAQIGPGTRVMAFAPDAFATHVCLPDSAAVAVPAGLDLTAAAAVPVVFVTAWEALVRLARLGAGETVLIHGAAGGVGLAAVQIARLRGARVLATAGSTAKRALARAAGADAVFDSRSLSFADQVLQATGGRGVDVVLSSLAGAAMQRSVECLAPFGRFVELGKRDFLEGTRMDLRGFVANLSYLAFDLDRQLAAHPDAVAESMAAIRQALGDGSLLPLPVTAFPPGAEGDAFRHMLAARHAGKVVIRPPAPRPGRSAPAEAVSGDWVILGGTGGLGVALAARLRQAGAQRVHLVSRSGEVAPGGGSAAREVAGDPAVILHALDAADPEGLSDLLARIAAEGALQGVIHAAMVLRDRMLRDLDPMETALILRAKLGVAQALDHALDRLPVPPRLICLSSVAARLGNPGQSVYAAANAGLEAMAAQWQARGVPSVALALGAVGDGGYLARNAVLSAQLKRLDGFALLPLAQVLDEVMAVIAHPPAQTYTLAAIDWARLAPLLPALSGPDFSRVVPAGAGTRRPAGELAERLRRLDWPAALRLVEAELRDIVAGILRMSPDQMDPQRPLGRYGVDSLMAMELRLEVERRFGNALPMAAISEETTPARLAAALLGAIRDSAAEET